MEFGIGQVLSKTKKEKMVVCRQCYKKAKGLYPDKAESKSGDIVVRQG